MSPNLNLLLLCVNQYKTLNILVKKVINIFVSLKIMIRKW